MIKEGIDPGKLYLTTIDGYFLPPNAQVLTAVNPRDPMIKLQTWQSDHEEDLHESVCSNLFMTGSPKSSIKNIDLKRDTKS